jgi:phosphoribosylformylglycinamidine cyclo-ligase
VFNWLKDQGRVADHEMLKTFNCGIGMIVCVPAAEEAQALMQLSGAGEVCFSIGEVVATDGPAAVSYTGSW